MEKLFERLRSSTAGHLTSNELLLLPFDYSFRFQYCSLLEPKAEEMNSCMLSSKEARQYESSHECSSVCDLKRKYFSNERRKQRIYNMLAFEYSVGVEYFFAVAKKRNEKMHR